jgi:sulfite exporter TauE/SafE
MINIEHDIKLFFSLFSLGIFGGFSHCIGMCGPFVITQASQKIKNIEIEKYSNFEKLKSFALLPYHLGRITTYAFIGFFTNIMSKEIVDFFNFKKFSAFTLLIASFFFINIFFEKKFLIISKKIKPLKTNKLNKSLINLIFFKINFLFKNPEGFNGYLIGLILGFIPCGLLYGAFAITLSFSNSFNALIGMIIFGLSTFPALFISAFIGSFGIKISNFKIIAKIMIIINIIMLLMMSFKQLT